MDEQQAYSVECGVHNLAFQRAIARERQRAPHRRNAFRELVEALEQRGLTLAEPQD